MIRRRWIFVLAAFVTTAACAVPIVLALGRVVPNAVRLGARNDPLAVQSALARAICRDHLVCLASIAAFVALQLMLPLR